LFYLWAVDGGFKIGMGQNSLRQACGIGSESVGSYPMLPDKCLWRLAAWERLDLGRMKERLVAEKDKGSGEESIGIKIDGSASECYPAWKS
jgi:hypothetical protein